MPRKDYKNKKQKRALKMKKRPITGTHCYYPSK